MNIFFLIQFSKFLYDKSIIILQIIYLFEFIYKFFKV